MNFKLNIQLFGNAVIPYNEGRNGKRSIDGLWEQEFNVAKALTAAIGCEFGSVLNIQDAGQKEQGKVYLDKNNGKLYKCLNTTTSVSNTTENFALFNVQQNSDRLDNLEEMKVLSRYFSTSTPSEVWNFGVNIRDYKFISISFGDEPLVDTGRLVIPTSVLTVGKAFSVEIQDTNEGSSGSYDVELLVAKFITDTSLQIIACYGNEKQKKPSHYSNHCVLVLFN